MFTVTARPAEPPTFPLAPSPLSPPHPCPVTCNWTRSLLGFTFLLIMASGSAGGGKTYSFKVVLLGEGCVGKTSLVLRYCENKFNDKHITTLQVRPLVCRSFPPHPLALDHCLVKEELTIEAPAKPRPAAKCRPGSDLQFPPPAQTELHVNTTSMLVVCLLLLT